MPGGVGAAVAEIGKGEIADEEGVAIFLGFDALVDVLAEAVLLIRAGEVVIEVPIEPLSERELDVLRLLRSDLDGPDIARELTISLNTMRTHTKNVYEKLGVNNRRSAVRRAEELELLQGHR